MTTVPRNINEIQTKVPLSGSQKTDGIERGGEKVVGAMKLAVQKLILE